MFGSNQQLTDHPRVQLPDQRADVVAKVLEIVLCSSDTTHFQNLWAVLLTHGGLSFPLTPYWRLASRIAAFDLKVVQAPPGVLIRAAWVLRHVVRDPTTK